MKLKIFNLLKNNETKILNSSLDVYRVNWKRIYGSYIPKYPDIEDATRFFTSETEANEFAKQLKMAYELLEYPKSDLTKVTVLKEKEGGLK